VVALESDLAIVTAAPRWLRIRLCPNPLPKTSGAASLRCHFRLRSSWGDSAFAVGHRRIAINLVAGTLEPPAVASTNPDTRRRAVEYRQTAALSARR
jgi:hypothetical protein